MSRFTLGQQVTYCGQPYVIVSVDYPEYLIQHEEIETRQIWTGSAELTPRKKANKYNARKVNDPEDGMFDSQAEYQRWHELKLLQAAGVISDLKRQVSLALILPIEGDDPRIKPVRYKVDFTYHEMDSALGIKKFVAEEVKGMWTDAARLKAYLFMLKYPHIKYVVTGTQL